MQDINHAKDSEGIVVPGIIMPDAPEFYKELLMACDNCSVLRVKDKGRWIPLHCTDGFARMVECAPQQFLEAETNEPFSTVYVDDRDEMVYLFEHRAPRGKKELVLRNRTYRGNIIWVNIRYCFFEWNNRQYSYCSYFDVTELKTNEHHIKAIFDNVADDMRLRSKKALFSLRADIINNTIDYIDCRDLGDFAENGKLPTTYTGMLDRRMDYLLTELDKQKFRQAFNILNLIAKYYADECVITETMYSLRPNGSKLLTRMTASVHKEPLSGNLVVFFTEFEYNSDRVHEIINQKVLAKQYDMIAYLMDGQYGVVVGEKSSGKSGALFPKDMMGSYTDYVNNQVIPVVSQEDDNSKKLIKALSLETIEAELAKKEPYTVNVICGFEGKNTISTSIFMRLIKRPGSTFC